MKKHYENWKWDEKNLKKFLEIAKIHTKSDLKHMIKMLNAEFEGCISETIQKARTHTLASVEKLIDEKIKLVDRGIREELCDFDYKGAKEIYEDLKKAIKRLKR